VALRDVGEGSRIAAATGAFVCFEDEAGQNLRPPKARTWGRLGCTPVVRVSGKGSGRVSMAAWSCVKPDHRGHLFYRLRIHRGRTGERRSLSEDDYAALVTAAHHQLHAPIVQVWDNVNTHVSAVMRAFIDAHRQWLTVVQLPAYAPDLNPVEGVWSVVKNGLGNLAGNGVDHLAAVIRNRLKRIQYRPELFVGVVVVAKDLLEPELGVEGQGSAHVSDHEHGLDSIELCHTRMLLPHKAFERNGVVVRRRAMTGLIFTTRYRHTDRATRLRPLLRRPDQRLPSRRQHGTAATLNLTVTATIYGDTNVAAS